MAEIFRRTWIEIDRQAIVHNYEFLSSRISEKTKLLSIVKANAYGHGLVEFAQTVQSLGVDYFGVYELSEAYQLRRSGIIVPVLVLGFCPLNEFQYCAENAIEITISNWDTLKAVSMQSSPVRIHLKVDTGLGRQGFLMDDIEKVILFLKEQSSVIVTGLYTHFAVADNLDQYAYTSGQVEKLMQWKTALHRAGYNCLVHAGASSVALFKEYDVFQFDMIRLGIAQYGLYPSSHIARLFETETVLLRPVLSWKTFVSELKYLPKNTAIGYDLTKTLERDSTIAVLPIGYWDGYPRSLSNCGSVLINGLPAPIVGRVCMNMCMVDVTDIPSVEIGDEVVIIGKQDKKNLSAELVAQAAHTINYELVVRINPQIDRIYL